MNRSLVEITWQVIGESIRGSSHLQHGKPNQDAITWQPVDQASSLVMLVISDGHGSPRCLRSDRGSRFAVQTTLRVLEEFAESHQGVSDLTALRYAVKDNLMQRIVRDWARMAAADLQAEPIEPAEYGKLREEEVASVLTRLQENPFLAYGATLLAILITPTYHLYLQLGDGDIVCVDASGSVVRPVPHDERLIANETTSLCMPNAWTAMRSVIAPADRVPPELIMASTDGYSNSFTDDAGFLQVGVDYLEMIRSKGLEYVRTQLPSFLEEASVHGSGDDITVGLISFVAETADTHSIALPPPEAEAEESPVLPSGLEISSIEDASQGVRYGESNLPRNGFPTRPDPQPAAPSVQTSRTDDAPSVNAASDSERWYAVEQTLKTMRKVAGGLGVLVMILLGFILYLLATRPSKLPANPPAPLNRSKAPEPARGAKPADPTHKAGDGTPLNRSKAPEPVKAVKPTGHAQKPEARSSHSGVAHSKASLKRRHKKK